MGQNKKRKQIEKGKEVKFISKKELQNMRLKFSIEVPQDDFDELIKAMMNGNEDVKDNKTHRCN